MREKCAPVEVEIDVDGTQSYTHSQRELIEQEREMSRTAWFRRREPTSLLYSILLLYAVLCSTICTVELLLRARVGEGLLALGARLVRALR